MSTQVRGKRPGTWRHQHSQFQLIMIAEWFCSLLNHIGWSWRFPNSDPHSRMVLLGGLDPSQPASREECQRTDWQIHKRSCGRSPEAGNAATAWRLPDVSMASGRRLSHRDRSGYRFLRIFTDFCCGSILCSPKAK